MTISIFDKLRNDHERQRELLRTLKKTEGQSEQRETLYEKLKTQLQAHATYEEQFFYSELMKDEKTIEKARHSVHEHHEIDEAIEALDDTDYSSPQWLPKLKKLADLVEHHLEEEEHEVFQMAGKVLNKKEKQELGEKYLEEMQSAVSQ